MNKNILLALGLAGIVLCWVFWGAGGEAAPTIKPTELETPVSAPAGRPQSAVAPAGVPTRWPDAEDHRGVIVAIQTAATTYEAAKVPEIQPYLTHPDPAVRTAAMNGIVELGYPTGASVLREAAARAATPEEAALLNAKADYLLLPSTYQLMKSKKFGVPMPPAPAPK